jgi:hypothetical protein
MRCLSPHPCTDSAAATGTGIIPLGGILAFRLPSRRGNVEVVEEGQVLEQIVDQRRGVDRRVRRLSFRFPDRRLGFARRQIRGRPARAAYDRMLGAYRYNSQSLALVLVTVAILNVADLVLTLRSIELGAVEVNPIMAALINADPLLASIFKVTIGLVVVAAMWSMRRYRRVLEASLMLLGGFIAVNTYSLTMLLASS